MIGAIVGHMIGIQLMYKSFNEIDDDMVDRAMNIGQNKNNHGSLIIKPEFEPTIFLTKVLNDSKGVLDLNKMKQAFLQWFNSGWSQDASSNILKAF